MVRGWFVLTNIASAAASGARNRVCPNVYTYSQHRVQCKHEQYLLSEGGEPIAVVGLTFDVIQAPRCLTEP